MGFEQIAQYNQYNLSTKWGNFEIDQEKANKNFSQIQSKIVIKGDEEFTGQINEHIMNLLNFKAGRLLFKQTFGQREKLCIRQSEKNLVHPDTSVIEFTKCNPEKSGFYCAFNERNEVILSRSSNPCVALAHEVLHLLNRKQRDEHLRAASKTRALSLIHPRLTNPEEQFVITGLDVTGDKKKHGVLNENLFLALFKNPPRCTHLGFEIDKREQPTICDYIALEAWGDVQSYSDFDVNRPYKTHRIPYVFARDKCLLPLTVAYCTSDRQMIDHLLKKGGDVRLQDDFGGPLHGACIYGHFHLVDELKKQGVDINVTDGFGNSVLMNSIKYNKSQAFDFLLKEQVDLEIKNNEGKTALMLAIDKREPHITKALIDKGAQIPEFLKKECEEVIAMGEYCQDF